MGYANQGGSTSRKFVIGCAIVATVVLAALIGGCNYVSSYDQPQKGFSAVCQTGGPIEGNNGTCGFYPAGSGRAMIGYDNTLVQFPATTRFWRAGNDPVDPTKKAKGADINAVELPASNGGIVAVSYRLGFKLKQDEKSMTDFYKSQGTRTFDGGPLAADDPNGWFHSWEQSSLSSTIEQVLREEVSQYACADLNPSCDLTKLNNDLAKLAADDNKDKSETATSKQEEQVQKDQQDRGRQANQNLATIATAVLNRLQGNTKVKGEFEKQLEGDYMNNMTFSIVKVDPPANLVSEINQANAALAGLVRAKADARTKVAQASGTADARVQEARGRKALAESYAKNSALADIEIAKALCGESGCQNLQVLNMGEGGSSNLLMQLKEAQK